MIDLNFLSTGRSRSEDSVYSQASEDGGSRSEGSTDSKSSIDAPSQDSHPHHPHHLQHQPERQNMFSYGIGALAALRKKRKKFSASRASTPAMTSSSSTKPAESVVHSVIPAVVSRISKKQLQRASSVPTRSPELSSQSMHPRRHEVTQSQQPSLDTTEVASPKEKG